ncbi:MAG: hypothetical protein FD123_3050 [Bacteroidetes bacterium]|nr:MAG: hypothetical protein FD123_3050 [Bacteroidota bacterium]
MLKRIYLFCFVVFACGQLDAQVIVKDSTIRCFSLGVNYAFQLPGGNLAQRFGANSAIGVAGFYKTKNNVFFGGQWSYLFGQRLKGDSTILDAISTSDGFVIDQEGTYAQIRLFERGMNISGFAGKVFNVAAPNPNSGILLMGGLGWFHHKIRIDDVGNRAPQVRNEYKKGYDRLTGGFAVTEFIGYWYMGKNRFVNFYGGFEFMQAATRSLRSWDYDRNAPDTAQRTDVLYGFRAGWIIPFYKRKPKDYYFN